MYTQNYFYYKQYKISLLQKCEKANIATKLYSLCLIIIPVRYNWNKNYITFGILNVQV